MLSSRLLDANIPRNVLKMRAYPTGREEREQEQKVERNPVRTRTVDTNTESKRIGVNVARDSSSSENMQDGSMQVTMMVNTEIWSEESHMRKILQRTNDRFHAR